MQKKSLRRALIAALFASLPASAIADTGFYAGGGIGGARLEQEINTTVLNFTDTFAPINSTQGRNVTIDIDELRGQDVAFKFFAGYQFSKNFSVEGAYVNLGEPEDSVPFQIPDIFSPPNTGEFIGGPPQCGTCVFTRGRSDREIVANNQIDGFSLAINGILPLTEQIEIFARIGAFFYDARVQIEDPIATLLPVEQPIVPPTQVPGGIPGPDSNIADPFDRPIKQDKSDGTALLLGFGGTLNITDSMGIRGEFEWYDLDLDTPAVCRPETVDTPTRNCSYEVDTLWSAMITAFFRF